MTLSAFLLFLSAKDIFSLLVEGFVRHLSGEELSNRLGHEGGRLRGGTELKEQLGGHRCLPSQREILAVTQLCSGDGLGNK